MGSRLRRHGFQAVIAAAALTLSSNAVASDAGGGLARQTAQRFRHWLEVGQASWYGLHLEGHKTSSGELFNMNLLTCAHRTLPLGSWIRVTNLRNSRSILVRVNDRGPVQRSRIVDLSYAAANALGLNGTAKVKLEAIHPGDPQIAEALLTQSGLPGAHPSSR